MVNYIFRSKQESTSKRCELLRVPHDESEINAISTYHREVEGLTEAEVLTAEAWLEQCLARSD